MNIEFTKMHGLGNDFVIIDDRGERLADVGKLSQKLCHRKFGIGADQLLLLKDSAKADWAMLIFNPDGSEAEMCGNGVRCFARYILDRGISSQHDMNIETKAGLITTRVRGDMIEVDMGEPHFEGKEIPSVIKGRIVSYPLKVMGKELPVTCVSMGNPHTIIFVEDVENFPVERYGPEIENHSVFPNRTNVEFARVISDREITMRVWERGAGETFACGTGACATLVAGVLNRLTHKRATVHLLGGDLNILWGEDGHVYMTGPAVKVFDGIMDI